jgi:hypothetical protein
MGKSMSVCQSLSFFLGGRQPVCTRVIVAQHWKPIVIVYPTVIAIPVAVLMLLLLSLFLLLLIFLLLVISWPCLRQVGYPIDSTISG